MRNTPTTALRQRRRQAWRILALERLCPALLPAAAALTAAALLLWLGAADWLPLPLRLALPPAALLAALVLAGRALRRLRWPQPAELDRRLERASRLLHRPLAVLTDRAVFGAESLWQAHRARAEASVAAMRAGWPKLGWSAAALGALAVALVACFALPGAADRAAALRPWSALFAPAPIQLQAWIVSPPSTLLPPFVLSPHLVPPTIPRGAHLTATLAGNKTRPDLLFADHATPFRPLGPAMFQGDLDLTTSGTLKIRRGRRVLAVWPLTVAPDGPPSIRLTGPPSFHEDRVLLPWLARDDYGLATLQAELRRPDAALDPPVVLTLPLEGTPRQAAGSALPDLGAHPWAGLDVTLRYVVRDTAGQSAATAAVRFRLPQRRFANPLAQALVDLRRALTIDPTATAQAAAAIDGLSAAHPPLSAGAWLNLRALGALLVQQPHAVTAAQSRLWQLALQLEDGGVTDARQQLAALSAALQQALAAPAGPERQRQIEALTRAYQSALQALLQGLRRVEPGAAQPTRTVDAGQLQQMAEAIGQAAKAGRLAEAAARLQALNQLLAELRPGPAPPASPALARLLADQATLQDRTQQRLAASGSDQTGQRRADAAAQQALRQKLGDLAQSLGEAGPIPQGLAQADSAMRAATRALAQNDDPAAQSAQRRALAALRDSAVQNGPPMPAKPGSDPLGRALGPQDATSATLPGGLDAAGLRALRDQVRARAADRTRPAPELDYLNRLLAPF